MINLWPEELSEAQGQVTAGFTLEAPGEERRRLWYRLPAKYRPAITEVCDPYLVAAVHHAMARRMDLRVHGPVSASLLGNLDEFMIVWSSWLPERYAHVEVIAESQTESAPPGNTAREAVAMFSGGVDSSYSAWRHRHGPNGRFRYNLRAGVMLHGFDIQLRHEDTFARAFARARIMLESIGMEAIPMATNLKGLGEFKYGHGALLASCLTLLQKRFTAGLIANSTRYIRLTQVIYGSNIITDELLSSDRFRIFNDGSGASRLYKPPELAAWPEALQYLRVCLGPRADQRDKNCCDCQKCVRNILTFRASGLGLPPAFEKDATNGQILRLRASSSNMVGYYKRLLQQARACGVSGSWTKVLRVTILLNQVRNLPKRVLGRLPP